jgi:hypothetical protein
MALVIPGACTLPTANRPLRLAEFDDLFAAAVRRVEPVDATHARLHLTGPAGLAARVRDLAARETQCCSFFTFTTTAEHARHRGPGRAHRRTQLPGPARPHHLRRGRSRLRVRRQRMRRLTGAAPGRCGAIRR